MSHSPSSEVRLQGIPVSPGIARGKARIRGGQFTVPRRLPINPSEEVVVEELARLELARAKTRTELTDLHAKLPKEDAAIFEAHLLVLDDPTVKEVVEKRLADEALCVEFLYYEVMAGHAAALREAGDSYLAERALDIEDVAQRVVRHLRGSSINLASGTGEEPDPHLIVAYDLTPSDTAGLNPEEVLGFATDQGSPTSHTAIIARSLGIPAVVGLHGIRKQIIGEDELLIDGYRGIVIIRPTDTTLGEYEGFVAERVAIDEQVKGTSEELAVTSDGHAVVLSANIELTHEIPAVTASGATGIGLYRTEFLFLSGVEPDEEAQAKAYTAAVLGVKGTGAVIFRTLDVGGDKIDGAGDAPEPNPFLGRRGIRVSLSDPERFRTQLRAILRSSAHGKVGIMYPMVSVPAELREANAHLEACKRELKELGVAFDPEIEVGVMIEVPSAVLCAAELAKDADFFSIGSNDLVQYTMAVDRLNERVADLYQPASPAVLRLIKMTVEASREGNIWTGVCGEVAADLVLLPVLIGLGIDKFSVVCPQVPRVKYALRKLHRGACQELAAHVVEMPGAWEVLEASRAFAEETYPELL